MHMQRAYFFARFVAVIGKSFPFDPVSSLPVLSRAFERRSKLSRRTFQWKIQKLVRFFVLQSLRKKWPDRLPFLDKNDNLSDDPYRIWINHSPASWLCGFDVSGFTFLTTRGKKRPRFFSQVFRVAGKHAAFPRAGHSSPPFSSFFPPFFDRIKHTQASVICSVNDKTRLAADNYSAAVIHRGSWQSVLGCHVRPVNCINPLATSFPCSVRKYHG